jgi:hypothetical protein
MQLSLDLLAFTSSRTPLTCSAAGAQLLARLYAEAQAPQPNAL